MRNAWTTGQMRLLRQLYRTASRDKLKRELAPHTWDSIRRAAERAGLRRIGERLTDYQAICASHVYQTKYFAQFNRVMEAAE